LLGGEIINSANALLDPLYDVVRTIHPEAALAAVTVNVLLEVP
jgi:hypothetical protein